MNYTEIDELCPLSGIGQPPRTWEHCYSHCAWIDPETNECAVLRIVTMLQDLPLEYFNALAAMDENVR